MFMDDASVLMARILPGPCRNTSAFSQRGDLELKTLIAQPAELAIRQADGHYRQLSDLVASAALLGEDGGVA